MTKQFDIKRDNQMINAGTHFWCSGCLVAKSKSEQSPDPRYCQGCYELLSGEKKANDAPDFWTKNNSVYITGGRGYCVTPAGGRVCIGAVDQGGNPQEPVFSATDSPLDSKIDVSKLLTKGIIPKAENGGSFETLKHPVGRPRKQGELSRVTAWRRQREETQGVLAL